MDAYDWTALAYIAAGLPLAWWYQRQDGHPEHELRGRGPIVLLFFLAAMWPILLLAILANLPDTLARRRNPKR